MIRYLLFIWLAIFAQTAWSQAPFRGGPGGGYAHLRITGVAVSNDGLQTLAFSVHPTCLRAGESVEIHCAAPSGQLMQVYLSDVAGRVLWKKSLPGSGVQRLPMGTLPAGLYFLHLNDGQHSTSTRISVTEN